MPRTRVRRRREPLRTPPPRSTAGLPEFDRSVCPPHLVTRRQLRELGLRPGGHDPVAVLRCRSCAYRPGQACIHPTRAWLWDTTTALPKIPMTLDKERALDAAMAARSTCPACRRRYHYCLKRAELRWMHHLT
ncbi:RRQRL motif-containing zinc-binding protein [Streptomyces fimicarius]|uniref:RRQRL motif-containing zinc-binding protein n=1 Tax=Streptomyces griseus TaxID=1911 RepID=UPI0036743A95